MSKNEAGLEFAMRKTAGIFDFLKRKGKPSASGKASKSVLFGLSGKSLASIGIMGGIGIAAYIRKIRNDHTRKALIEQLMVEDPILKNADREQLLEYYATIYMFAPDVSKDKNAVRELLVNFVRFGKVDFQSINSLVQAQTAITKGRAATNIWKPKMQIDPIGGMGSILDDTLGD